MIFTGNNLQLVRRGIDLALSEIKNQIATCPDVFEFSDELDDLDDETLVFQRLLARIDRAIARETT